MPFSNKLVAVNDGFQCGMMKFPWLITKENLIADSPSRRDGLNYEEELSQRQKGGVFIYETVMHLTSGKGENALCSVALTLFNRFFKMHSFKRVDYRDVAAACVLLASKNVDSPKRLKYIVNQLWQFKFPKNKQFPSEKVFKDQCDVVIFLEEILIKTMGFDLEIDFPHPYVLQLVHHIEKEPKEQEELVKSAYKLSTDVLAVTDWSIRYSPVAIATACVNISAFFQNKQMSEIVPEKLKNSWFEYQDSSLNIKELDQMTTEFVDIYAKNPWFHIGSLRGLDPFGKVKITPNMAAIKKKTMDSPPEIDGKVVEKSAPLKRINGCGMEEIEIQAKKMRLEDKSITSTSSNLQNQKTSLRTKTIFGSEKPVRLMDLPTKFLRSRWEVQRQLNRAELESENVSPPESPPPSCSKIFRHMAPPAPLLSPIKPLSSIFK